MPSCLWFTKKKTPRDRLQSLIDYTEEQKSSKDIGSWLNQEKNVLYFFRSEPVLEEPEKVIVLCKIRLCSFGFEQLVFIYEKAAFKIVVDNEAKPTE